MTTTRTFNWRDLVTRADPDWEFESRHPVVYRFPYGRDKRDSGPSKGIYEGGQG